MTTKQLAEIELRTNSAKPGPWLSHGGPPAAYRGPIRNTMMGGDGQVYSIFTDSLGNDYRVYHPYNGLDADFIAHARKDVPALVAEVRRLRQSLEKAVIGVVSTKSGVVYVKPTQRHEITSRYGPEIGDG